MKYIINDIKSLKPSSLNLLFKVVDWLTLFRKCSGSIAYRTLQRTTDHSKNAERWRRSGSSAGSYLLDVIPDDHIRPIIARIWSLVIPIDVTRRRSGIHNQFSVCQHGAFHSLKASQIKWIGFMTKHVEASE